MAGGVVGLVALLVVVMISSSGGSTPSASTRPGSHVDRAGADRAHRAGADRARRAGVARPADQQAALARFAALGKPIYCASRAKPMVALTFDDGPGPYTRLALRKLKGHHARATFFLVGRNVPPNRTRPAQELRVAALGDHSYTHPYLPGLDPATMRDEISRTQRTIQAAAHRRVGLFRPPYGARNPRIDAEAKALGMVSILWDVDSRDSEGADYAGIAANVRREVRPGSIILLHENRGQTIRALQYVFKTLKAKHLQPVTVPELLAADPPTGRQVRAGPGGCGSSAGTSAEGR